MKPILYLLITSLFAVTSCKTEEPVINPPVSDVPELRMISVEPTTVAAMQDQLTITLGYIDGDGDLGFDSADSVSLFVTDDRIDLTEGYSLQPLTPSGAEVTIEGVLPFVVERTILIDPSSSSETVTFSIQLRDRSGNLSNVVTSPPITVVP